MVAGAAALLLPKTPFLHPDPVEAKLVKSASASFPTRSTCGAQTIECDMFTVGAGYLDVLAALNSNESVPAGKSALSPSAT